MPLLSEQQRSKIKKFIYRNGRLLEQKLYEYYFESGNKNDCLNALIAYQNPDGGFGNGLEPDLLCPHSTAIGAETALYILDLLDAPQLDILDPLVAWIAANQTPQGLIPHPPEGMQDYPFQPWWANPDDNRILAIAGLLKKLGVKAPSIYTQARLYYESATLPASDDFYGYPYFLYLLFNAKNEEDTLKLEAMRGGIPTLLAKHGDHIPLLSRYWVYAHDAISPETLNSQAKSFTSALQEDGGLAIPYPELPWWRPIFTLDGLIHLKIFSFL